MLLLRDDRVLETFQSPGDPPDWIEWIDVQNNEYEFCDEDGQRYRGTPRVRRHWRDREWELVREGAAEVGNALSLVERAVAVDARRCLFTDLQAAQRHIIHRCSGPGVEG